MTKAEIVKAWKPELRVLGFTWRNGAFEFENTRAQPLQRIISIQRNIHRDTYKINPTIILKNPLADDAEREAFLFANLRRDGIRLHVTADSWWPPADFGRALQALKTYVVTWFDEWAQPARLVDLLETAIQTEESFIAVAEPLPDEATRVPWRRSPQKIRVAPMYYYQAAVLHYLNDNRERSIARTRDWIASLRSDEHDVLGRAHAQLATLESAVH